MANLDEVLSAVVGEIQTALSGMTISAQPVVTEVATDWPSEHVFHDLARAPLKAIVCVNQHGQGKNETRYISTPTQRIAYPLGIAASTSAPWLQGNDSETVTIGYAIGSSAVNLNDGIGLAAHKDRVDEGATAWATTGETLASLALKLANSINNRDLLKDWIEASASGAVVTLTNKTSIPIKIEANCGNVWDSFRGVGRSNTDVLISVFTPNVEVRKLIGERLEPKFGGLNFLTVPNSQRAQLRYHGTRRYHDDTLKDLYRQDFFANLTYTVTKTDRAYSVLVAISKFSESDA